MFSERPLWLCLALFPLVKVLLLFTSRCYFRLSLKKKSLTMQVRAGGREHFPFYAIADGTLTSQVLLTAFKWN